MSKSIRKTKPKPIIVSGNVNKLKKANTELKSISKEKKKYTTILARLEKKESKLIQTVSKLSNPTACCSTK